MLKTIKLLLRYHHCSDGCYFVKIFCLLERVKCFFPETISAFLLLKRKNPLNWLDIEALIYYKQGFFLKSSRFQHYCCDRFYFLCLPVLSFSITIFWQKFAYRKLYFCYSLTLLMVSIRNPLRSHIPLMSMHK